MKKDNIEKQDLTVLSDGEFTAEVFSRAKRKKATVRKRIVTAVVSVCSACFVLVVVGIGFASIIGGSSKSDPGFLPPAPSYAVGYTDYILYDGQYILLSQEKSDELKKIVALANRESGDISADGEYAFEQGFVAMIDGVRYVFFDGGVSYNAKIIKSKTVGNMATNFIKSGL